MPLKGPSQYDCDNIKPGDVIIQTKRSFLYRLYRDTFCKDKQFITYSRYYGDKMKIRAYQEDCVLVYRYEIESTKKIQDVMYNMYFGSTNKKLVKVGNLKEIVAGPNTVQFLFKSNLSLVLPTPVILKLINESLEEVDKNRIITDIENNLRYKFIDVNYIKTYVKDNNIKEWNIEYCCSCGKPLTLEFTDDKIITHNNCICGAYRTLDDKMSYEELVTFLQMKLTDSRINKYYIDFWIGERKSE